MSNDGWKFVTTVAVLSWASFSIAVRVISPGPARYGGFPSVADVLALIGGVIIYLPIWFGLVMLVKRDAPGELMVPRNARAIAVHLLAALGTIGAVTILQFLEIFR